MKRRLSFGIVCAMFGIALIVWDWAAVHSGIFFVLGLGLLGVGGTFIIEVTDERRFLKEYSQKHSSSIEQRVKRWDELRRKYGHGQ